MCFCLDGNLQDLHHSLWRVNLCFQGRIITPPLRAVANGTVRTPGTAKALKSRDKATTKEVNYKHPSVHAVGDFFLSLIYVYTHTHIQFLCSQICKCKTKQNVFLRIFVNIYTFCKNIHIFESLNLQEKNPSVMTLFPENYLQCGLLTRSKYDFSKSVFRLWSDCLILLHSVLSSGVLQAHCRSHGVHGQNKMDGQILLLHYSVAWKHTFRRTWHWTHSHSLTFMVVWTAQPGQRRRQCRGCYTVVVSAGTKKQKRPCVYNEFANLQLTYNL